MRVLCFIVTALLLSHAARAQLSRADVVMLYDVMYVQSRAVPSDWTGNVSTCNAGTTSAAYQQAAIDVINYYRLLSGLPANVARFTGQRVQQTQNAALMMAAQNSLSHAPGSTWACYSPGGATAAGQSNLALGNSGIDAVDAYIDDYGGGNYSVGHRRWMLYPRQVNIASGSVPRANALWVLGPFGSRVATPDGVAWPGAGFIPYDLLPSGSQRWSFSYPNADFSNAYVSMSSAGYNIPVTLETLDNRGFGDRTLVWRPTGVSYSRPTDGDISYLVTVSNVVADGANRNFSYEVIVIDPDATIVEPEPALFRDDFE